MTQPAFSRRIRALEEWLGAVIFRHIGAKEVSAYRSQRISGI
jgi:DNA-binding transcriptional LysR family regulator